MSGRLVYTSSSDADEETLHELFAVLEGIDTDHPDYAERFDQWAAEYRADVAAWHAEGRSER